MAEELSKIVNTTIQEVTVYTSQALVTRRGSITLEGAEKELEIKGLPLSIRTESFRASGKGTAPVKILGVKSERKVFTEPVQEKVAELTRELEELEEKRNELVNSLSGMELQKKFVDGLGDKAVERFATGLARNTVGLDETRNLLGFLGQERYQYASGILKQEKDKRQLEKEIEAVKARLNKFMHPRYKENYSLLVGIEAAGAGEFELEISYVVDSASWTPLYDLRVNGAGTNVNLSYLAEVNQSSGEDWHGVILTLSTAKPGLGTLPPKLDPWFLDLYRPPMPRRAAMRDDGAMMFATAAAPAPVPPPAPQAMKRAAFEADLLAEEQAPVFQAASVAAQISSEGGVVTFRLDRSSDIPGDGGPHKITIFSDDYICRTEYIAMPRLVSFAYQQATVLNKSGGATLLPGTANIFRDNTFVGSTHLENIAPGQEFQLNLGIDEGLKIERDMVEREVDKKLIGNTRRITFGYRLTITNLKEQEAGLKLTEQIPTSRNEQIKIKLNKTSPSLQPGEMGVLEWQLALAAKNKREIYYQFTVEHPADVTITGLNV
jgi:uncharacterized protein (TIGR02231 family)